MKQQNKALTQVIENLKKGVKEQIDKSGNPYEEFERVFNILNKNRGIKNVITN